jgi:hypothetical protein
MKGKINVFLRTVFFILLVLVILTAGCVSKEKYVLRSEFDNLQVTMAADKADLENQIENQKASYDVEINKNTELTSEIELTQAKLEAANSNLLSTLQELITAQNNIIKLQSELDDYSTQPDIEALKREIYTLINPGSVTIEALTTLPQNYESLHVLSPATDTLYIFSGEGVGRRATSMYSYFGFSAGGLGGGTSYIFPRLGEYWSSILKSLMTIILVNPSSESLSSIDSWPAQYKEICPFSSQELQQIKLPFALIKRQDNGKFRAIVVAQYESGFIALLKAMTLTQVPIGTPWTIK